MYHDEDASFESSKVITSTFLVVGLSSDTGERRNRKKGMVLERNHERSGTVLLEDAETLCLFGRPSNLLR